jgi:hypothetical protein
MPRIRFSLKTLFVVLLIGTLAGSHVFTSYRLKKTHDENIKLRTELGYLTIEDRSKVHVVELATHEELKWQWRVYVPEGAKLVLKTATHDIPDYGLPEGTLAQRGLGPGEHLLTAAVRRDRKGKWALTIAMAGTTTRSKIPEAAAKWLSDDTRLTGWMTAGGGRTETKKPGKPLRLIRLLAGGSPAFNVDDHPPRGRPLQITDGLMIWIDDATQDDINTFFR